MNYGSTNAKTRGCNPGLRSILQSTLRLFATLRYRVELSGAIACLRFLPVAVDGAALLWGGLQ